MYSYVFIFGYGKKMYSTYLHFAELYIQIGILIINSNRNK